MDQNKYSIPLFHIYIYIYIYIYYIYLFNIFVTRNLYLKPAQKLLIIYLFTAHSIKLHQSCMLCDRLKYKENYNRVDTNILNSPVRADKTSVRLAMPHPLYISHLHNIDFIQPNKYC
jgi:hypothetical protein